MCAVRSAIKIRVLAKGAEKNEIAEIIQFDGGAFNRRMFIGLLEYAHQVARRSG
jgi:hypothetical protein